MSDKLIIKSEPTAGVIQLQLNRPDALNALNTEMLCEIAQILNELATDESAKVIILTGNSKAFAAGADVSELKLMQSGNYPESQRQNAWDSIRSFPKPMIAAINGFSLGGGCELMLHADIIIAASDAQIGQPEIKLGIMPGAGGTQYLPRRIGKAAAMYLNLTGDLISAQTALQHGLISEITEPEVCLLRAQAIAKKITKHSINAAQAIKQSVLSAYQTTETEGLEKERQLFIELATSPNGIEGIDAFLEKRRPNFSNTQ